MAAVKWKWVCQGRGMGWLAEAGKCRLRVYLAARKPAKWAVGVEFNPEPSRPSCLWISLGRQRREDSRLEAQRAAELHIIELLRTVRTTATEELRALGMEIPDGEE